MNTLKFLHVLFVFIWLGSLLSITRLLVYQVKESEGVKKRLWAICKRFYLTIDLPSMVLAVAFGLILIFNKVDFNWKAPWIHLKLTLAACLIITDLVTLGLLLKPFKREKKGVFRLLHGLVGLFLIAIFFAIYIMKFL